MIEIANILFYIAVPIFIVYFFLFNKTMRMIEPSERKRYIHEAGSKYGLFITVALFGALFFFRVFQYKLIISVLIVLFTVMETIRHHKKLKVLKFPMEFEKRLLNISYLSGLSILLILTSIVLNAKAT